MLFNAILQSHLNPMDFEYTEARNDIKINVNSKRFYFNFTSDRFIIFPFKNLYTSHEYLTSNSNFDEYIYRLNMFFKDWLKLISSEMQTEDQWEAFIHKSKKVPMINSNSFTGDRMSYVEVQNLIKMLTQVKNSVEKMTIDKQIKADLFSKMNYLVNKAKTIEQKDDWINLSKGVLITELVKMNRQLKDSEFNAIMSMLKKAFQSFFTFGF